ncbi:LCP family protein [Bacillus shivajii]|uniref:LCP family glycopolymer transferase n=1 Tax=Bacillus shivajii TaxID=1983719 RepID=UPI001CFB4C4A|nr:LCP family protein [Bacillus shivajii]UCZ52708.1 LCP family protein [Bacillus shivajii]
MTNSRTELKKKKQTSRFRRTWKTFGIFFFVTFLVLGSVAAYMAHKMHDVTSSAQLDLERGDRSDIREEAVTPSKDSISILFLGVDDRTGNLSGRTDAMLLATFNEEEGTVKLLNIPRDSLVEIPGRGQDKINHAHAFGGIDLTIDTVENLLNVPVDYFVTLNFTAFMEIINTLGGVEVDVPFSFTEMDSEDRKGAIAIEEGIQTLSGEEALAYARMRKQDPRGDLGRGDRQKQILEALINKGASFSSITRFNDILDSIENHMKMNLSFTDLVSLHSYAPKLNNIDQLSFEGDNTRLNGIFYYQLREESVNTISKELRQHLDLENPADSNADTESKNNN